MARCVGSIKQRHTFDRIQGDLDPLWVRRATAGRQVMVGAWHLFRPEQVSIEDILDFESEIW
jgi:hypothetical protein